MFARGDCSPLTDFGASLQGSLAIRDTTEAVLASATELTIRVPSGAGSWDRSCWRICASTETAKRRRGSLNPWEHKSRRGASGRWEKSSMGTLPSRRADVLPRLGRLVKY